MKRTAADFLADAKEPYELELPNGKVVRPKSLSQLTYDERVQRAKAEVRWQKLLDSGADLADDDTEVPFHVDLKVRFGKDYKVFWAEAKNWQVSQIAAVLDDVDAYYDPTPSDDKDEDAESETGKGQLTSTGD